MKIALVAISSNSQLSGITRHVANVARSLLLHSAIEEVHLIVAPWEQQLLRRTIAFEHSRLHMHCVFVDRSSPARNLWLWTELPLVVNQLNVDVAHLSMPVPVNRRKFNCPVVVSIHDLYPYDVPENWGFPRVLFNRAILRQCIRAADALACVSGTTLEKVRMRFPEAIAAKAHCIFNTIETPNLRIGRGPIPSLQHVPFLLCVAQHRRNKNIDLALRVFHRLIRDGALPQEMLLLIVGMPGPETGRIERIVEDAGLEPNVLLLSGISDADLQWCYRHCDVLLAPSIIEGFGLPVAEGLLVGCRIVCSDIPAFRELAGDRCRYFALGNDEEAAFAAQIRAALLSKRPDPVLLPQLDPARIASEYMALYEELTRKQTATIPATMSTSAHVLT